MELGTKVEKRGGNSAAPVDHKEPKVTFPELTLRDKIAKQFIDDHEPTVGMEFACTAHVRVSSLTDDEYGQSFRFEVLDVDEVAEERSETEEEVESEHENEGGEEEESDEEETKVLGYKRKAKKIEVPGPTAAELAE